MQLDEKYILDKKGNKESVVLPYKQYLQLLEVLEDNEDYKDYLEFLKNDEELINFDDVVRELDL